MPLLLDFESRSEADLEAVGGRRYWEHPSTQVLCCVAYDTDDDKWILWGPGDHEAAAEIIARANAHNWAAHNASGFDRFAMARLFGVTRRDWIDTSELARTAGLPGALEALGLRWLDLPKDKAASAYTKSLSRQTEKHKAAGTWRDVDWLSVVEYCESDVEILRRAYPRLEKWRALEPDVVRVDRIVNDRGIGFDVQLATRLLEIDAELADTLLRKAAHEIGEAADELKKAAKSQQQFVELTGLPDAQKQTVDDALATGRTPDGKELTPASLWLCRARRALATIAGGKLEAGLARVCPDGRLRDTLRYYGAHTGRWSGLGFQPQNLPRPDKRFETWSDDDVCRQADRVLAGESLTDPAHVDLMLRACIVPRSGHKLITRDFESIEARALALCAGDDVALEAFAAGRDLYKVAASSIFGVPYDAVTKAQRQTGKVAELALGYQGGPGALEQMARSYGVDLEVPGIPPVRQIVASWRRGRPAVVRFWRAAERAIRQAVLGGTDSLAACAFEPRPKADGVAISLPSGRPIVYNDTARTHEGLTYHGTKGRREIYGGKIVENLIQGLCRDLMAGAMVAAENAGLPVVLTVHDEIVCEVDERDAAEAAAELNRIMRRVPEWAAGMPISASGFVASRYRK